jgi:hypothetical protein
VAIAIVRFILAPFPDWEHLFFSDTLNSIATNSEFLYPESIALIFEIGNQKQKPTITSREVETRAELVNPPDVFRPIRATREYAQHGLAYAAHARGMVKTLLSAKQKSDCVSRPHISDR